MRCVREVEVAHVGNARAAAQVATRLEAFAPPGSRELHARSCRSRVTPVMRMASEFQPA